MAQFNTLTYTKKTEAETKPTPPKESDVTVSSKEPERKLTWKRYLEALQLKQILKAN